VTEQRPVLSEDAILSHIEGIVRGGLEKVLGVRVQDIDLQKQFSEYGVDSVTGVELINSINASLGIVLRTTALFDYASVGELSRHIQDNHGASIAEAARAGEASTSSAGDDDLALLEKLSRGEASIDDIYNTIAAE
jgi:acyl carrier protein